MGQSVSIKTWNGTWHSSMQENLFGKINTDYDECVYDTRKTIKFRFRYDDLCEYRPGQILEIRCKIQYQAKPIIDDYNLIIDEINDLSTFKAIVPEQTCKHFEGVYILLKPFDYGKFEMCLD